MSKLYCAIQSIEPESQTCHLSRITFFDHKNREKPQNRNKNAHMTKSKTKLEKVFAFYHTVAKLNLSKNSRISGRLHFRFSGI